MEEDTKDLRERGTEKGLQATGQVDEGREQDDTFQGEERKEKAEQETTGRNKGPRLWLGKKGY